MRVRVNRCLGVALTVLVVALSGAALAAGASKDEAVAMVKKAVAAIKAEGADKAYAEISNPQGPFVDRDLYIVVYRIDGVVLAHGADKKLVGVNFARNGLNLGAGPQRRTIFCSDLGCPRLPSGKTGIRQGTPVLPLGNPN
jgi:hypothetical protein